MMSALYPKNNRVTVHFNVLTLYLVNRYKSKSQFSDYEFMYLPSPLDIKENIVKSSNNFQQQKWKLILKGKLLTKSLKYRKAAPFRSFWSPTQSKAITTETSQVTDACNLKLKVHRCIRTHLPQSTNHLWQQPSEEASCGSSRRLSGWDCIYFASESPRLDRSLLPLQPDATLSCRCRLPGNAGSTQHGGRKLWTAGAAAATCCRRRRNRGLSVVRVHETLRRINSMNTWVNGKKKMLFIRRRNQRLKRWWIKSLS